jgi:hypothetical protein
MNFHMKSLFVLWSKSRFSGRIRQSKKTLAPSEPKSKPSRASEPFGELGASTRFLIGKCLLPALPDLSSLSRLSRRRGRAFPSSIRLPMTSSSYSSTPLESF